MKNLRRRLILLLGVFILAITIVGCQINNGISSDVKKTPEELGINSSENMTDEENRAFNRSITDRMMSYLENKYDEEFELKGRVSTSSRYGRTYKVYAPETDYTFEPAIHGDKDTPVDEWYINERYFSRLLRGSIENLIRVEIEKAFGGMTFVGCGIAMKTEFGDEFLEKEEVEKKHLDGVYMVENEPENISHLSIDLLLFRDFNKEKKEEFYVQLNQFIERIREMGFTGLVLDISFYDESTYIEKSQFFGNSTAMANENWLTIDGLKKYLFRIDHGEFEKLEGIDSLREVNMRNIQGYIGNDKKWEEL